MTFSRLAELRNDLNLEMVRSCMKLNFTTWLICLSNFNAGSNMIPRFFARDLTDGANGPR